MRPQELARAFDLDRARLVEAETPVGGVHVMADPVHQHASAVIEIPAPSLMDPRRTVRRFGRGAEPALVVQLFRRRHGRILIADSIEIGQPAGQHDRGPCDLADTAVAHQFAGEAEVVPRPLPASRLPDPSVALDGRDDRLSLGEILASGFSP